MSINSPHGYLGSRPIRPARRLGLGLIALLLVLVGGTLGYVAFGYGVLDAVFQAVITVSTVGFGEVHRFGPGQKVFTIVLILTGVGSAAYSFTVLVETLFEGYLADEFGRRRMGRQIRDVRDHVVLCGWVAWGARSHTACVARRSRWSWSTPQQSVSAPLTGLPCVAMPPTRKSCALLGSIGPRRSLRRSMATPTTSM